MMCGRGFIKVPLHLCQLKVVWKGDILQKLLLIYQHCLLEAIDVVLKTLMEHILLIVITQFMVHSRYLPMLIIGADGQQDRLM
ncbi:hypothetical protein DN310_25335 [Salmonella enterica subsp. salamae]|uniref:Uncharacterized protein n=1 Tax=Salmonella enterica subsp. salamae TaxID=59202 RepID=A0A5Y3MZ62_SALER|nr:hypothetical protein [Salmonella enterica subsp. salamae]